MDKTKIVVFRRRGNLHTHGKWSYNDNVEVVDTFKYLGILLSYNG